MSRFSAHGEQNLSSSTITALHVVGTAATRGWVYELIFGNSGTPADLTSIYTVQRITAIGTEGAAVTPAALDSDDAAAVCDVGENHSVEPTYTANTEILEVPVHHRALFRWAAVPRGEIVLPATAAAGIGVNALHASATTLFDVVAMWWE